MPHGFYKRKGINKEQLTSFLILAAKEVNYGLLESKKNIKFLKELLSHFIFVNSRKTSIISIQ